MNERNDTFIPIVFLGNKGSYSIARAFHEQYGVKTEVVASVVTGPIAHSKILNVFHCPELATNFLSAIKQVVSYYSEKYPDIPKLVLGSEDTSTEALIENRHLFEGNWIIPYVGEETLHQATDKSAFYAMCEKIGIPYPKTWNLQSNTLPHDAKGKLVVKPAITPTYQNLHFEGKQKVYFCKDETEAQQAIDLMRRGGYPDTIIIQQFIQGDDTDQAVVTVYRSPHDKQIKMFTFGHVMVEDRSASAAGNHLAILTENQHDDVLKSVTRIMEAYDFTGYANFDLIYNHKEKSYLFFELNPRLGLSNYYVTAGGQNVACYYVEDYLFNREVRECFETKPTVFTVLPKFLVMRRLRGTNFESTMLNLYRQKRVKHPLDYPYDRSWQRKLYVIQSKLNYIRKFHKTHQL